ncbi:hypothetical protein COU76_01895 [Candidatus Peregrinibacteria bacterium CG10_big_fil_rev_8_21_14_0_10_49_10]|nr:MAG: hypothetical protein COU76_01895 [Candidatus Peregrinibacteria bacterium CG10_big_fil_rev_8_21_14_0_10_49_10]
MMPEDKTKSGESALDPEIQALIPSGTEIYDFLMAPIEPELLSSSIPTLREKYAGESEEEKQKRLDRYNTAFAAYDKAYDEWISGLKVAVKEERTTAYKAAEVKVKEEDEEALTELEKKFGTVKTSKK